MATKKPAINNKGLAPKVKEYYKGFKCPEEAAEASGVFCRPRREPQATYIERECETMYKNEHGSYICMGKDNLGPRNEGYGGKADTGCAAIDMVVGRAGYRNTDGVYVDPLPFLDAARVYISQKTDCDANFGLVPGTVGNRVARSAVVIKADGVRIMGSEGIKLVTGQGIAGEKNSMGGDVVPAGIDLIAMNDDGQDQHGMPKLQPLVKGENLIKCLNKVYFNLDQITDLISTFLMAQIEFNTAIASHPHISPFFAAPTTPSPMCITGGITVMKHMAGEAIPDLIKGKVNFTGFKNNYLSVNGPYYILSAFNNTN